MFIHDDGLENVAEGIIKQARKDFIKAGKQFFAEHRYIPTEIEYWTPLSKYRRGVSHKDAINMYDAWRFVKQDPYDMFDMGEETIINSWKIDSIIAFYKDEYVDTATLIFAARPDLIVPRDQPVTLDLTDDEVRELIGDQADRFIVARNYISELRHDYMLSDWAKTACGRVLRAMKKGNVGKISIENTLFAQNRQAKRIQNIEEAKRLWDEGLTKAEIGEKLGVTKQCVNVYLRS